MMENWLRGGFEMDRKGNWRLKPQVADTLERDVRAIMAQSGWSRSISRSADTTASAGTTLVGSISASTNRLGSTSIVTSKITGQSNQGQPRGAVEGLLNIESNDKGANAESARSSLDIINYEVRAAIASAEASSARSSRPEEAFAREFQQQVLGQDGLRDRYLQQADGGRGTFDLTSPITSMEKSSLLRTGRFTLDPAHGPGDGDSSFKDRQK